MYKFKLEAEIILSVIKKIFSKTICNHRKNSNKHKLQTLLFKIPPVYSPRHILKITMTDLILLLLNPLKLDKIHLL